MSVYPNSANCATAQPSPFFARIPRAVNDLVREKKLKRTDAQLLCVLQGYGNRNITKAYPLQSTLAANLGCSVDTVQRGLKRLIAVGILVKIRLRAADGRFDRCVYDFAPTLDLIEPSHTAKTRSGKRSCTPAAKSAPADGTPPVSAVSAKPTIPQDRVDSEADSDVVQADNSAPAPVTPSETPPVPAVVENLAKVGMRRHVAANLAVKYGETRCRQALAAVHTRRNIKDKPAWLYRCLTEGWTLTPTRETARPQCQHRYTPPPRPAAPPRDLLETLPASRRARLEEQARAQLIAEHAAPAAYIIRRSLEAGRSVHLVRLRMRELLAAPAAPPTVRV